MEKTSFSKTGWTISLFFVSLYLICLAWQVLLTDQGIKILHQQLLAMTFPGFTWLSLGSFIWGLVLSFIYGWVGAAIYVWLHGICCGQRSE